MLFCFSDHGAISGCEPSWYQAGKSCYQLSFPSGVWWSNARTTCHRLNADLAVFSNGDTLQSLAQLRREMNLEEEDLFVGLSGSKLRWLWLDGENVSDKDDLWGPNEPSGTGKCGTFLNAGSWNSDWYGYGWRLNDGRCVSNRGYICEQPLGMHVTHLVGKPVFHGYLGWVETEQSVFFISKLTMFSFATKLQL